MSDAVPPADGRDAICRLAQAFGTFSQVLAVAFGGSRAGGLDDPYSDFDLYVYTTREVPIDERRKLLGEHAEIGNQFWEPGDESIDQPTGARIDIMYRTPEWIEGQLDRILFASRGLTGIHHLFLVQRASLRGLFDPR